MKECSFYWAIASYKRADRQPMLHYLHELGYTKDEIIISTQTEEDFEEYKRLYSDKAIIIYAEAHSVGGNKNTLLKYAKEHLNNTRLVICSDKVRGVGYLDRRNKISYFSSRYTMDQFVKRAFFVSNKIGASIWGCYSVGNAFFMKHMMETNMQMLGCFMGICNPAETLFDEEQYLKEDFELILRLVKNGKKAIRFSDVCLKATLHTKGGCHSAWNDDKIVYETNARILEKYKGLVIPHPTRKNEIRYVGPTEKIKRSILEGII